MASVVSELPDQPQSVKAHAVPWMPIAWFGVLLVVAYFPVLRRLVLQWSTDEDVGHGFFVPLVAAYAAWDQREMILAVQLKPTWVDVTLVCVRPVGATLDSCARRVIDVLIDLLDPDAIIIGGGVSAMLNPFFPDIRQRLPRWCINSRSQEIPLMKARYGADAGIAGGAALCAAK